MNIIELPEAFDWHKQPMTGWHGKVYTEDQMRQYAAAIRSAALEEAAEFVWPTQQDKVWSDDELTAMTQAFNRAQEKHGWYETIMAVGAAALKGRAAAIRALKESNT